MAEIVANTDLLATAPRDAGDGCAISFRAAVILSRPLFWTGLRPMTPDGTPVVGRTRYKKSVLNTGHGTLGAGDGLRFS